MPNSLICILVFFFTIHLCAQPFTKETKEILELTDKRNTSEINFDFYNINESRNRIYYSAQFLSILNLGDTLLVDSLINHYNNSDAGNKGVILSLLGYLSSTAGRKFLLSKLSELYQEEDAQLLDLNTRSLGRIGLKEDIDDIFNFKGGLDSSGFLGSFTATKLYSLFQFATRRITNDVAYKFIAGLSKYALEAGLDYQMSYILNRTGDKNNLSGYKNELITLTKSPRFPGRMWAFSALGKLQDTANIEYLLESLAKEEDWRVRVNLCNALGSVLPDLNSPLINKMTDELLQRATQDASNHVSIVALQTIGKLFKGIDLRNPVTRKIQQEIQFILTENKAIDWQIKAEAVRTYAVIFKDECKDELLGLFSHSQNYDLKAAIVGSFSSMENAMVYKELRDSISIDVQRYNIRNPNKDGSMIGSPELAKIYLAFVDALTGLDDKMDDESRNNIRLILSEFSASKNPAITDLCLTNLQDSIYLQYRGETCQIMVFDYSGFKYPADKDVMILYIETWNKMKYGEVMELLIKNLKYSDYDIAKASADALKNITGKDYEKEITAPKYRTDFDWDFIDRLQEKKFASILTNRGIIKIELSTDYCPFTVQNFIKLGEKGFYNNTVFHRVVPNFVIQGGDPTGTGYGGPGYSIRSEFTPDGYNEYTVGMASSGKDTEGSQFFITHSPQPHLDGKYTLFGKVIEGFDVVDKIQIGDVIETITFSPN